MAIQRFEVYFVNLAPITTHGRDYLYLVACRFQGKEGQVVLDQIRTVDKTHLVKLLGRIEKRTQSRVLAVLQEMFAE